MSDFEWQSHAAFDHGDVHAGPSAGHHTYDSYPNTQGNIDFEQPVQHYDGPGSQFSAGGHLELPSHDISHLNVQHGNYLVPSGSSQQGVQMTLPHSFQAHDGGGHYYGGHNYNFTLSHGTDDPPPLPDTYHSVVSHSSNNSQPAMSNDGYYFMRSDDSNVQAPLDPIPEVTTQKLIRGRHTSRKTKRATSTRTKFLNSKYVTQESSLSMEQASSSFVFLTPTLLQDFKGDARTDMFKNLFEDNLFPSASELSTIANNTLDATIARYTSNNVNHGHELIRWKSGPDAKNLLARLKAILKEIHGDFEEIASISWISAYDLSLDLSLSRDEMQAARVANIAALLSDFLFVDKIVEVTMDDGQIRLCRTPCGHKAIFDLLEHIISCKQYSRYIPLDTESWQPLLTNVIALAVTSRAWSLQKALAGPWSAALDFRGEENKVYYTFMKSRLRMLPEDERLRFEALMISMHRALR
ncbi:uncharacterized protein F5891DRAFT_1184747 [Suillus fuscotomentosus]|uniref:Uncharacterized protein n=1 Tax=Suillus fuscotomentosus TaxID=1912939 RepID=A0AAD4ECX2_9AGAM|nr:uncharacterized protein F5891DRAFT_1184747 [Suillus fuscotomentosus]KAG1903800.1 hypothetical protein F5891DRAFT_1184747 [Suillus fuscotomentosus]